VDRRALLLALPLALACTTQAPSVALTTVCAAPSDASACTYAGTCAAQYIGTIAVDASRDNQLFLAIEAANQLPKNGDTTAGRASTAEAYIQEVRITYAGPLALPAATHRLIQKVPANGTAVVAFPVMDVIGLATLPAGVTSAVVIAKVTAKGVFGDGGSFETPEYEIPVVVCDDCIGDACPGGVPPLAACPDGTTTARRAQAPNSYVCP